MLKNVHASTVAVDPQSLLFPASDQCAVGVVDSSLPVANDVSNLFARFGASDGAARYLEIHSDADAAAAAARWPLLAEWLAAQSLTKPRR